MLHLLVLACTVNDVCAERWLPAADTGTAATCEAAAAHVIDPWLHDHDLNARGFRCVATSDLPAIPLEEVAPGVLVHRGARGLANSENGGAIANLSAVIGPTGIAVIDPGGSRSEGEALLAALRQRSALPVTTVIITHVHPDHSLGAEVFREAGARLLAHDRFAAALAARVGTYSTNYRDIIGEAAYHGSRFVAPDEGVGAATDVEFGGDQLRLIPAKTAHTDNDMAVWHQSSHTLFTGDLVFRGLTPVVDGSLTGWLDWLGTSPMESPSMVVPGHGAPASGWITATAQTRAYLGALAKAVRRTLAADLPLSKAVSQVVADLHAQAAGLDAFEETTRRNAAAAFKELEWE